MSVQFVSFKEFQNFLETDKTPYTSCSHFLTVHLPIIEKMKVFSKEDFTNFQNFFTRKFEVKNWKKEDKQSYEAYRIAKEKLLKQLPEVEVPRIQDDPKKAEREGLDLALQRYCTSPKEDLEKSKEFGSLQKLVESTGLSMSRVVGAKKEILQELMNKKDHLEQQAVKPRSFEDLFKFLEKGMLLTEKGRLELALNELLEKIGKDKKPLALQFFLNSLVQEHYFLSSSEEIMPAYLEIYENYVRIKEFLPKGISLADSGKEPLVISENIENSEEFALHLQFANIVNDASCATSFKIQTLKELKSKIESASTVKVIDFYILLIQTRELEQRWHKKNLKGLSSSIKATIESMEKFLEKHAIDKQAPLAAAHMIAPFGGIFQFNIVRWFKECLKGQKGFRALKSSDAELREIISQTKNAIQLIEYWKEHKEYVSNLFNYVYEELDELIKSKKLKEINPEKYKKVFLQIDPRTANKPVTNPYVQKPSSSSLAGGWEGPKPVKKKEGKKTPPPTPPTPRASTLHVQKKEQEIERAASSSSEDEEASTAVKKEQEIERAASSSSEDEEASTAVKKEQEIERAASSSSEEEENSAGVRKKKEDHKKTPPLSSQKDLEKPKEKPSIKELETALKKISKKPQFTYHERVTRWLNLDEKSVLSEEEFSEYQEETAEGRRKKSVYHGFSLAVDDFLSLGFKDVWKKDGSTRTRYILPAEISWDGHKKRGVIAITVDKNGVCYHRCFHENTDKDLIEQIAKKSFKEYDFPPLGASLKKAKAASQVKENTEISMDAFGGVVIEDHLKNCKITLFKTKLIQE